jgi:AraC-like DNA-binding protein
MTNPYLTYFGKMKYRIFYPEPELSSFIEKYVFYENNHITNDVCLKSNSSGSVELFIHYNESYIYIFHEGEKIILDNFFVGLHKLGNSFYIMPISKKESFKAISISFTFEGVYYLLKSDIKYFTDKIVNIETILGEKSKLLIDSMSESKSDAERVNFLNQYFIAFLNTAPQKSNTNFISVIKSINKRNACCSVEKLANYQKCTDRTIQRLFKRNVGVCPKDYLKIFRFNRACRYLSKYPDADWLDIVYDCGYYDQMHLNKKDSKSLTGE